MIVRIVYAQAKADLVVRVVVRDDKLVQDFIWWTLISNVHPVKPAISSEGHYEGFFSADDYEAIKTWLKEKAAAKRALDWSAKKQAPRTSRGQF